MTSIIDEYLEDYKQYKYKYGKKTLVLIMIGSFYELFSTYNGETGDGPNLHELSQLLNIICTRKDKSIDKIDKKNPYMLGFPTISATKFINILVDNGYTVVVKDQVSPPPNPSRKVTNIYSPGTYINGPMKPDYNFIISIYIEENIQKTGKYLLCAGMSAIDVTTGKCHVYEAYSIESDDKYSLDECIRFINGINPVEIIIIFKTERDTFDKDELLSYLELTDRKNVHFKTKINKKYLSINYQTEFLNKVYPDSGQLNPIEYLELDKMIYTTISLVFLLDFIYNQNNKIIDNLNKPTIYFDSKTVVLGNNAINQLNVVENHNVNNNTKYSSLFNVVNKTSTAMGRRFLKHRLTCPIVSHEELNNNYNCIEEIMVNDHYIEIEQILKNINDIERYQHKIPLSYLHPYEYYALLQSYDYITKLINMIKLTTKCKKYLPSRENIKLLSKFRKESKKIFNYNELQKHNLNEITSNIFNKNIYDDIDKIEEEIDHNKNFMNNLQKVLSKYVEKGNNTFISIKKNERDGHYLSITKIRSKTLKKNLSNVKSLNINGYIVQVNDFVFKDNNNTTKIILPAMEEKSDRIIELENEIKELNMKYYNETIKKIYDKYNVMFSEVNKFVSYIDFIKSNAKIAKLNNYIKPKIKYNQKYSFINCKNLRHPIIEMIIDHEYIPHDFKIGRKLKGILLYGLNSSGKSSSMKALGLSTIMAQAGMFVPASKFVFSPFKSIFTRITGNDNLFKGLSSFTLEMLELKAILRRADPYTLVIGDEVCRGTEHISGNAIVASTIIKLAKLKSSFIFATHLHEIAKMERIKQITTIKPYHLSVTYDIKNDTLIYDRKLKPGSGEDIYGITVAKYIIDDPEFIDMTLDIKNELLQCHDSLISGKKSKYNSKVLIHECQICKQKDINGYISNLQTHHINFQKDFIKGKHKDKNHILKNNKSNLIVVCIKCHQDIHSNGEDIEGLIQTSKGVKLKIKSNTNKQKNKFI